ncbi:MAG: DUF1080 domain-containing protein [Chloroflexi bacterium]|nr:DUF1080 domain-containing protein [Chloroflexota bacterium]
MQRHPLAVSTLAMLIAGGLIISSGAARSAGARPPQPGAIVLFSGKQQDLTRNWLQLGTGKAAEWTVDHGAMLTAHSDIYTRERFTDFRLHVEFKVPYMPNAHGQGRGNSGVYLQGRYEIQVLDSYGIAEPGSGDCGAVYSQAAPLVNACKPPLQWQTYDIFFRAPRFDPNTHEKTEPARVTILQNGILVQNNQVITGPTGAPMDENYSEPGPLRLQYHGNNVQFRNVWVAPLPLHGALHY